MSDLEQRLTKHDIYTILFDRIIRNQYPEDSWLREDLLAREFRVSRSPVRSVLRDLEQDHLIEILPKRGARVFPFTADDLEDIYELRRDLELLALKRASHSLSIQRLLELKADILALKDSSNTQKHVKADSALHTYIIESSGRRRLILMLRQLYRLTQTFRELSLVGDKIRNDTIREHTDLVDALCIRDIDRATTLLADHIENSKIRVLTQVIQGKFGGVKSSG